MQQRATSHIFIANVNEDKNFKSKKEHNLVYPNSCCLFFPCAFLIELKSVCLSAANRQIKGSKVRTESIQSPPRFPRFCFTVILKCIEYLLLSQSKYNSPQWQSKNRRFLALFDNQNESEISHLHKYLDPSSRTWLEQLWQHLQSQVFLGMLTNLAYLSFGCFSHQCWQNYSSSTRLDGQHHSHLQPGEGWSRLDFPKQFLKLLLGFFVAC